MSRPTPPIAAVQVTVRLPVELSNALTEMSVQANKAKNELMIEALRLLISAKKSEKSFNNNHETP